MSSSQRGKNTSVIAVTDISPDGIWVLASDEEHFLPFDQFPWFKKGTVEQILNVIEEHPGSYHWPDLDIDLGLDSITNPERYPLKANVDI
ncbi:MAG: DUF2442 domain-containing protein [bacterium]|nr:DUF2442 domain-containing protein [Gammaproteobacteria bacterium]HIL94414.1 DUF2442 domain-containing protein [Pseudomonadales bacterium]